MSPAQIRKALVAAVGFVVTVLTTVLAVGPDLIPNETLPYVHIFIAVAASYGVYRVKNAEAPVDGYVPLHARLPRGEGGFLRVRRARQKLGLCVGINAYPRSPLRGCVNDARAWGAALLVRGYGVTTLLDGQATKEAVVSALEALVASARFGDRVVLTYSGHGTYVPDRDGDESDNRDEALVMADMRLLTDDELHAILSKARYGVRVTVISDSCHSGTMARFVGHRTAGTARFLPPQVIGVEPVEAGAQERASRGKTILLSGCADHEVSYDAHIDGRYQGAMTAAAIKALPGATSLKTWHAQTVAGIGYPQTPQLTASTYQAKFAPLA